MAVPSSFVSAQPETPGDQGGEIETEHFDLEGSILSSVSCGHSESSDSAEAVICFTCFVEHTSRAQASSRQRTTSSISPVSASSGAVPTLAVTLDVKPPRPRKRVGFRDYVEIYPTYSAEDYPYRSMNAPDLDAPPKRLWSKDEQSSSSWFFNQLLRK